MDSNNATTKLEQVRKALEVFNQKYEFKPGDIVQLKPGMERHYESLECEEPVVVVSIGDDEYEIELARINSIGEFDIAPFDSRRFEPYKPVEPDKKEDVDTTNMKYCPFCGKYKSRIVKYIDQDNSGSVLFWRKCEECGAVGPVGKTLEAADKFWNERQIPPCFDEMLREGYKDDEDTSGWIKK